MSKIDEILKKVGTDFNIDDKPIKVIVSTDGDKIINIRIEILEDNTAKIQTEKFEEYVNTLPDDLFMATLELLGQDEIKRIDNCIHSNNLESIRAGILKFKQALSQAIKTKMTELNQILPSCS